ncbi:MAG: biliverdin-producing heme oxygenase [Gammaproteobacteria bacterium]|nr:biliverdin-producing heme oxygenase [Gammaproteobacteria bacterium]
MNAPSASVGLSAVLREQTRDHHRMAEGRPLVRALLSGGVGRTTYAVLLRNLYAIYATMESAFDLVAGDDPELASFAAPPLRRRAALETDLKAHHGLDWAELPCMPASEAWTRRLQRLAAADPTLLVAHAYVRYLGDLSGGKVVGSRVGRHLGLDGGAGLAFYRFPEVPDPTALKEMFRRGLDSLEARGRSADMVAEARRAFDLNRRLFDQIDARRDDFGD